jgi:hypothetical protein
MSGNSSKGGRQVQKAWCSHLRTFDSQRLTAGKDHGGWNSEGFGKEDAVRVAGMCRGLYEPKVCGGMQYDSMRMYCMDIVLPFADSLTGNVYRDFETR